MTDEPEKSEPEPTPHARADGEKRKGKRHRRGGQRHRRWQEAFLREYRKRYSIWSSCIAIGIDRSTFYAYKRANPEFAQQVADAWEDIKDSGSSTILHRAIHGHLKPIYQGGKRVGQERVFHESTERLVLTKFKKETFDTSPIPAEMPGGPTDTDAAAALRAVIEKMVASVPLFPPKPPAEPPSG